VRQPEDSREAVFHTADLLFRIRVWTHTHPYIKALIKAAVVFLALSLVFYVAYEWVGKSIGKMIYYIGH
jgi:hypothetical protein